MGLHVLLDRLGFLQDSHRPVPIVVGIDETAEVVAFIILVVNVCDIWRGPSQLLVLAVQAHAKLQVFLSHTFSEVGDSTDFFTRFRHLGLVIQI